MIGSFILRSSTLKIIMKTLNSKVVFVVVVALKGLSKKLELTRQLTGFKVILKMKNKKIENKEKRR
jgi:hypothetical protein